MLLHTADGMRQGRKKIATRNVDTDVVVLAVSFARRLGCESLVVAIGTGKSFRYVDATAIAHVLNVDKCIMFRWKRHTPGLGIMESFSGVTPALCTLADTPSAAIPREVLPTIEWYVVVLNDRGSSDDDVNRT